MCFGIQFVTMRYAAGCEAAVRLLDIQFRTTLGQTLNEAIS